MDLRGDENAVSSSSDGLGKCRAALGQHLLSKKKTQNKKEKNELFSFMQHS